MQEHRAELLEFVPDSGSCVRTTFVSVLACWQWATVHHKDAGELGVTSSPPTSSLLAGICPVWAENAGHSSSGKTDWSSHRRGNTAVAEMSKWSSGKPEALKQSMN